MTRAGEIAIGVAVVALILVGFAAMLTGFSGLAWTFGRWCARLWGLA